MITDASIKSAIKSVATELTLTDKALGKGAGSLVLVVRRMAAGNVTAQWFAKAVRDGKRTKKVIGRYPEMSLAMARQHMATQIAPALRAGKKLRASYKGEKPTVERMFQAYVDDMKAKGKTSYVDVERSLLLGEYNAADELGRERLAGDVEPADVVDFVQKYYKRGARASADKARSYVSSAYNWALRSTHDYMTEKPQDWGVTINPAAALPKDMEAIGVRDRHLDADELAMLWAATAPGAPGFSIETAACIRLLITCGQRVQETLRVAGAEIDLDGKLWNMPAEKTKMQVKPHTIPLTSQAVDVLRQLIERHGDGNLFVGRVDGKDEIMDHRAVRRAITRWRGLEGVKIDDFQTRDIRRTWKSRAHDAGVDRFTRDLIQQHAKSDTGSKHYDRADYLPQMREAMGKWETWLDENVVNIQQQRKAA